MGNGSVPVDHGDEARRVLRLARLHRRIQILFLFAAATLVLIGVLVAVQAPEGLILAAVIASALIAIIIFVAALMAMPLARAGWGSWLVMVVTLGIAVTFAVLSGSLYGGAVVIWFVGPLAAVFVTHRMYKRVRATGVRVGLLGVREEQLMRFRSGICFFCGYDLSGLSTALCPECGKAISEAPAFIQPSSPRDSERM